MLVNLSYRFPLEPYYPIVHSVHVRG